MKINVKNVGKERLVSSSGSVFTSNSIDVDFTGLKIELQRSVANQKEISYAEGVGIRTLGIPLFQVVRQIKSKIYLPNFRLPSEIQTATQQYRDLLLSRPNSIGDWFLQYPQDARLVQSDRAIIHQIQTNAGAKVLSDIEVNREQDENTFESQILALRQQYPNKVVCPTIDIGMQTAGLFGKKIDVIIKNKFDRFNVFYRSIPDNFQNWIVLSVKLFGQDIWCNVVGVLQRWYGNSRISNISRTFLFGIHSASLALPWSGSVTDTYSLNGRTLCFDLAPKGMSYARSRADSVLTQDIELGTARNNTISGTFFTNFVPAKQGLSLSLRFFP